MAVTDYYFLNKLLAKDVRVLPEDDIFQKLNLGDDTVNKEFAQLQRGLSSKLKNPADISGQCLAYNNLGTAYHRLFKFDKAEICHNAHLRLSNPSKQTGIPFKQQKPVDPKEKKCALINLGCVYHAKREYELAVQTFKKALIIAVKVFV